MKKIPLILIMVFGCSIVYSQNLKPDVISTAGSFYTNGNNSVSWTIGECFTATFPNATNTLTQGFQQGIYDIETAIDNTENLIKINLFPNPTADFVNLEIQLQNKKDYFFQLSDMDGTCLKNGKITSEKSEISLSGFSNSTYILNVFTTDHKLLKSFKIIKIN
ncbi:MAG TPA: T9SS type A sorting domain-containing protein [Prolixibacteraceae bacterium]|nr:T9SS type A sorting domain-containing protein [Prolixibacteraceae bacterium]